MQYWSSSLLWHPSRAGEQRGRGVGGRAGGARFDSYDRSAWCRLVTASVAAQVDSGTHRTAAGPAPVMACKYMQMNEASIGGRR